jgi:hypothetical protein
MGPADSDRLSRVRSYSGAGTDPSPAAYGAITLYGRPFQDASARVLRSCNPVLQPRKGKPPRFRLVRFRSPLLTESRFLSFPGGNEMFQFPPFATRTYGFSTCSFGYSGINARLTAPPDLSQSSTPFVACRRQDIPHMPLVAWPHWSRPRRPPSPGRP